jgi:hypothetical protein
MRGRIRNWAKQAGLGREKGREGKWPRASFKYRNTFLILQTLSKLKMILNPNQF